MPTHGVVSGDERKYQDDSPREPVEQIAGDNYGPTHHLVQGFLHDHGSGTERHRPQRREDDKRKQEWEDPDELPDSKPALTPHAIGGDAYGAQFDDKHKKSNRKNLREKSRGADRDSHGWTLSTCSDISHRGSVGAKAASGSDRAAMSS